MLRVSGVLESDRAATFLVPGTTAIALCERDGFMRVDASWAIQLFDRMGRMERAQVRAFAARLRLSSLPLPNSDDARLFSLVRSLIRSGRLVGVRQGAKASARAPDETAARRRLVRTIEGKARGRLSFMGRQYKLVVDVDLARIPGRDDYEVVGRKDAAEVLARLAAQQTIDLAALLRQASEQLTQDWRPPISQPNGLILLRRMPVLAATGIERDPAITPSQMAKLIQSVTLEVVVLGLDDKPLKGVSYVIEAPDAETYDGDLGPSARTKITSAKKGAAGVTLKWADAEASA